MHIRMGKLKKVICAGLCTALLMGNSAAAMAADLHTGEAQPTAEAYSETPSNVTYRGPLTIEAHLQARMGYSAAHYTVYIYAPSDVVGIQINDMAVLNGNSVKLYGDVKEVWPGTFESITVKVTLHYADGSTYSSYETIDVNQWCGVHHSFTDRCTP